MLRSAVSRTTLAKATSGGSSTHGDGMHPNLGLHSAAATGNIGLVKFALENGQHANSNLNGILPLHAACSGGSEQSVRMLIFHGADVNAPRLKAKGSSGGPGAEGSTPLHFAAANGHLEIVRILLEAGARPAATDKDGVSPEALALGNGHAASAHLIRSWVSAYGSNGLAGMVESRDTVSGDVTLGPAGYIRYAASGRSASPLSPTAASKATAPNATAHTVQIASKNGSVSKTPQLFPSVSALRLSAATASSGLTAQSSYDTLSAHAASKLAAARQGQLLKNGNLCKTSSNPNLRAQASAFTTPPLPVASPASLAAFRSQPPSASASIVSPGLSGLPPSQSPYDTSDHASTTAAPAATRSSSATSAVPYNPASATGSGSVRESKRRPSLPSILEKAAHPAASIRAALASGSSSHLGGSMSQASSSRHLDQAYDTNTTSPGKKHSRLAGKRSLSNMLRKATGSSTNSTTLTAYTPSMHTSSSSFFADTSAASTSSMFSGGAINMDALAKPGRVSGKSFDYQRPSASSLQRGMRRNAASESSSEDTDAWEINQAASEIPPLPSSRSDAAALEQHPELRSASSSSSLSAAREQFIADGQVRRARAGSNEHSTVNSLSRLPPRAGASLDLLRPRHFSPGEDFAGRKSTEKYRLASNQTSRMDAMRRAGAVAHAVGSETASQQTGDAPKEAHFAGRDRSVSGSSSRSIGTTDNDLSGAASAVETLDEDDLQEFLHQASSEAGDRTLDGSEHHESHRIPAGLRTMSALRQQAARAGGDSSATEAALSSSTLTAAGDDGTRISSALASRITRDRSGSHVSAVSSGSHSGTSTRGVSSASLDAGSHNSPGLAASYQAMSIAEENGLKAYTGPPARGSGNPSVTNRAGQAPSVADSVGSHASSSSLRSNYLSAAEQAQAILNQETPYAPDGPDGTSASLAAQLAAYGEALSMERKRAGDARSGASPSLSARGSNAALRSKLPSVSEDQSPSRSANHSSRSFSVSGNRTPHYPATAAQIYNRRVSRRPHSSEGRQSQDGDRRNGLGGLSGNMTISHSSLSTADRASLGLDRSATPNNNSAQVKVNALFPPEGERTASPHLAAAPGLGLPMHAQGWTWSEQTRNTPAASLTSNTRRTHASDDDPAAPTVPPKDAIPLRCRHERVTFNASSGLPLNLGSRPADKGEVAKGDDEDEDDPKTPVLGGGKGSVIEKFATSPRSLDQHSPSMPTDLSSYTAATQERAAAPAFGENSMASSGTSLTSPMLPPRKESIVLPGLGLEDAQRILAPDSALWSTWKEDEAKGGVGGKMDGLRRPSLNMLRSATSSSSQSQTPSYTSQGGTDDLGHSRWSTDETTAGAKGDVSFHSTTSQAWANGTGKRRLVRTLLSKAKGSS
ncbi:uncharacterized protein MEPE_06270 [Melanopsichium pennsylvanicum]|uniref:Ankyrin repeat protein n=2 Tax=Melanopsichium pennsylvanicum TaxID=63383 RepID=A0AAJ4XRJ9_9BASI|nr:ankyrin repeat protein [Melanopsichium pennsylvanicum 4]SNX87560.1 uncharacterized protein MEPE_06270 [Melanopsichium pennsylvanicum]